MCVCVYIKRVRVWKLTNERGSNQKPFFRQEPRWIMDAQTESNHMVLTRVPVYAAPVRSGHIRAKNSKWGMCAASPCSAHSMMAHSSPAAIKPPVPVCENMETIAEIMDTLRSAESSTRRTTSEYLMFCLIGFGSMPRRNALLTTIAWTLEPILLYSAYVKPIENQEFEADVITKKQVRMDAVEEWLGLFNMSVCCIEFEQYMHADMVASISRIHHMGKYWHGSFKTKVAARVRRDFYKEYMKQQHAKEQQRVVDITGLTLTPQNMISLHGRISSLQTYVSFLERQTERPTEQREAIVLEPGSAEAAEAQARLGAAYRRLQAAGALPPGTRGRVPRPLSPPASPTPSSRTTSVSPPLVRVMGSGFVARPPPTGLVTVFVVRQ
jgi:hypothetical protein